VIARDFDESRSRILARLSSYVLFLIFLVSVLTGLAPSEFGEPGGVFSFLNEIVERSPTALWGLFLLYFGFCGDARPAIWECRFAGLVRHFLRLLVLLYLLLALAVLGMGGKVRSRDVDNLSRELQRNTAALTRFRQLVVKAPNTNDLARLVSLQPGLSEALRQQGGGLDPATPLEGQRIAVFTLLERSKDNLRRQHLRSVATTTANSARVIGRLVVLCLLYALFYGLTSLIWPRSLAGTVAALRLQRHEAYRQEIDAEAP
jgi:hypothetical protein